MKINLKSHVLRPLWVLALAPLTIVLIVRYFYVPDDFGVGERGFTYGYHRMGNEDDWKNFEVKFKTREYCKDCHPDKIEANQSSKHMIIECENCHGPAFNHPEDPLKLTVDRSRNLCLRCHSPLQYPSSGRENLKGIDPKEHNIDMECADCHNPHKPDMEA
jgi:predicted CXXCH cytochrome family protein